MNKIVIIAGTILTAGIIVGVGYYFLSQRPSSPDKPVTDNTSESITPEPDGIDTSDEPEVSQSPALLAGSSASYSEFTQEAFDEALQSDKIVFLEFYANWCPICRVEQEDILEGFNKLERDDVIGFRANFKDDETTDDERVLAQELEVTYQHTKVIFVSGEEVLRSGDPWDTPRFLDAFELIET